MKSLSPTALRILEARYLRRDSLNRVVESPKDLFRRVAHAVAQAEAAFSSLDEVDYYENEYYRMMSDLEFLPNSPTLMNAGKEKGQLAACFVLPVPDSIEGITRAVQQMGLLHRSGAGTGFSFSSIRPKNDPVSSTGGQASGPVSFLKMFDNATEVARLGRQRRGANMGVLRVDHPDILDFIRAKQEGGLENFNLSIGVSSHFMRCLKKGTTYPLVNPRNGKIVRFVPAREVFEALCQAAWDCGDPGLLFLDEINRHNPTPQLGNIEATNPCGEQPLLPYECCNLGSINLANLVSEGEFDEERFEILIDLAVRFLDNVIDVNYYPLPEIQKLSLANRKIGLGVMGFADMLMKLEIPYDSAKARSFATTMMKLFLKRCRQASISLAKQRGAFANYKGSLLDKLRIPPLRNATLTTIAPSGTLSLIANTTGGIEPAFALAYYRKILEGEEVLEILPQFQAKMKAEGLADKDLYAQIAETGSIQGVAGVPKKLQELFKTAMDLKPLEHVKMQAVFQKYTDNAVSKTVNLPEEASSDDVHQIYMAAYEQKCKGITVFRYGSREDQVLSVGKSSKKKKTRAVLAAEAETCDYCITYQ